MNSELIKLKKTASPGDAKVAKQIDNVIALTAEHRRSLMHDLNELAEVDGYDGWRYKEASELSDLVQRRLHYLQNPEDCKKAQKLVCRLNKVGHAGSGMGIEFEFFFFGFRVVATAVNCITSYTVS